MERSVATNLCVRWMPALVGVCAVVGLIAVAPRLYSVKHTPLAVADQMEEVLYLPSNSAVKLVSFGYQNFLADLIWFKTISYFGKHYASDKNQQWLFHMCDLVTSLDPNAKHVYEFAANMLAWEVRKPDLAVQVLDKAVAAHPRDWKFYYLRGFMQMYFLGNKAAARDNFIAGANLADAPVIMARLAAKQAAELDDPRIAVQFLRDMLRTTKDPSARKALEQRLTEVLSRLQGGLHGQ